MARTTAPFLLALALVAGCAWDASPGRLAHGAHGGGGGFTAGGEARVSFAREVVPVLRQHCASCHGGAAAQAPAFFDAAGAPDHAVVGRHAGQILLELQTGRMPEGRPYAVPSDQFRTLDVWAASGAPDN